MLEKLSIPKALKSGDKVGVVTSSWGGPGVYPWKYQLGKAQLEKEFGLEIIEMPNALKSEEEISERPDLRAKDLMDAFKNPEIKAIFSTIGGDDSIRMLPYIDFDIIRQNPKIFLGYSDSTITHFISLKAGLRSYYGPSIMSGFAENGGLFEFTKEMVNRFLFQTKVIGEIHPCNEGWVIKNHTWKNKSLLNTKRAREVTEPRKLLQGSGCVQGRLIGGCMDVMEFMKGTELWPSIEQWEDSILFFDTSKDALNFDLVSYWLRNYAAQGILGKVKGVLIGRPGGGVPVEKWKDQEDMFLKVIQIECGLSIPVLSRLDFGHTDPQIIIPYGALAEINCDNLSFSILEPSVI